MIRSLILTVVLSMIVVGDVPVGGCGGGSGPRPRPRPDAPKAEDKPDAPKDGHAEPKKDAPAQDAGKAN
jgi:hypothetical protein